MVIEGFSEEMLSLPPFDTTNRFNWSKTDHSRADAIPNWKALDQTRVDVTTEQFRDQESWTPLCSPCISRLTSGQFQLREEGVRDGFRILELGYKTTPLEAQHFANQNCTLCRIIVRAIEKAHLEARRIQRSANARSRHDPRLWISVQDFQPTDVITVWLELSGQGQYLRLFQVELVAKNGARILGPCFRLHARMGKPAAKYIGPREIITDVASPEALAQAAEWLRECTEAHVDCPRIQLVHLPKRVVDVSPPRSEEFMGVESKSGKFAALRRILKLPPPPARGEELVRVFESEGVPGKYAALSYCWGMPQTVTLTKDVIEEFREAIPLKLLPATLVDAILVTRRLGLRYLWIDALCILQDSKEDKNEEIPKIREIFKNAYCTISAASAFTAYSGFLHGRPRFNLEELRIPLRLRQGDELDTVILYYEDQLPLFDEKTEPIEKRAWTLEEKMLSSRVLVYSSTHLRWLCRSSPLTVAHEVLQGRFRLKTRDGAQITTGTDHISPAQRFQLYEGWDYAIREYTRRSLTDPHDIFRAISGIAREFQAVLQEDYIAGMWSGRLGVQLLWNVTTSGPLPRPTKYRAPSWSWASVTSEVDLSSHSHEDFFPDTTIEKWSTTPAPGQGPTGELEGGYVMIRGPTKAAWWDAPANSVSDITNRLGPIRGKIWADSQDDLEAEPAPVIVLRMTFKAALALKPAIPLESVPHYGETIYRRVGTFFTVPDFEANDEFWDDCADNVITII